MSKRVEIMSNILYKSDQYREMETIRKKCHRESFIILFMPNIDTDSYIATTAVRNHSIFIKNEPHKISGDLLKLN